MEFNNKNIGRLLLEEGLITEQDYETAVRAQKYNPDKKIVEILIDLDALKINTLMLFLNKRLQEKSEIETDSSNFIEIKKQKKESGIKVD